MKNVSHAPQIAAGDQILHGPNAVVEQKNMSDGQQPAVLFGQFDERFGIGNVAGQRLFDEHVLAGFEGFLGEGEMRVGRRGDDDGIGGRIGGGDERIRAGADRGGDIAMDRGQARFGEIANDADLGALAIDETPEPGSAPNGPGR